MLKLVCWNMAYWTFMNKVTEAWDYLYNSLNADVALLTEMGDPAQTACPFPYTKWQNVGVGDRYSLWGSGIVSRRELSDGEYNVRNGAVITAELKLNKRTLTLISMYGLRDDKMGNFITLPNLHRYLSDLTPILNGKSYGRNIIIGGDWNADMQLDGDMCVRGNTPNAHKVFFDRVRDFNLCDCLESFADYPVRTWRNPGYPDSVSQLDYCYASPNLKVKSGSLIETPEVTKLSDHNPLVIEFDI